MAFAQLRVLGRIRRSLEQDTCRMLASALVVSRVDYCISLFNGASGKLLKKLQRVISSSRRLTERGCHPQAVKSQVWLTVKERLLFRTCSLMWKVLVQSSPTYLAVMFTPKQSLRSLRSNEKCLLSVAATRTEMGKRALSVAGALAWNSLPMEVRAMVDGKSFREAMEKHYLTVSS